MNTDEGQKPDSLNPEPGEIKDEETKNEPS